MLFFQGCRLGRGGQHSFPNRNSRQSPAQTPRLPPPHSGAKGKGAEAGAALRSTQTQCHLLPPGPRGRPVGTNLVLLTHSHSLTHTLSQTYTHTVIHTVSHIYTLTLGLSHTQSQSHTHDPRPARGCPLPAACLGPTEPSRRQATPPPYREAG